MGMANSPYKRILPPNYADGKTALRRSVNDANLPNERNLSINYCLESSNEDNRWTNFMPNFGQFVTHDITALTPTLGF
jgi:peroxidase